MTGWFKPDSVLFFSVLLQNGELDPAVKALEARQDEIMRKLYELKAAVEGLAKTVMTPDADLDLTVSSSLSSQSSTTFKSTTDLDTVLGKVKKTWLYCLLFVGTGNISFKLRTDGNFNRMLYFYCLFLLVVVISLSVFLITSHLAFQVLILLTCTTCL